MQFSRFALLLSVAVLPFGACQCEEPLSRLAPKIEVGDPFDPSFSVCADSGVRDCAYDFGEVDIGGARVLQVMLRNPSPVDLQIRSITFADGSDPAFTIDGEIPTSVGSNIGRVGEQLNIKYSPLTDSPVTATLIIDSDAENLLDGEKVEIQLTGKGVDRGQPDIEVTPPECNFGDVGVGATALCQISVNNVGQRELLITDIGFTADTPQPSVFGPQGFFPLGGILPGTGITATFYARPSSATSFDGAVLISSSDPDEPEVTVPLHVQGAEAPTAIPRVKSINGTPNSDPNPPVEPLDNVVLSGDQSTAARAGGTITAYQWEIVSKPVESSVTLSAPAAVDTGFRFSSAAGIVSGVDVAGTFVIRLTVTDDLGAVSTNDARVTLNAVPRDGLHIQMTWDVNSNDIDLHLNRAQPANWCSNTDDCFYANCDSPTGINWGGGNRNPHLDIDDLSGFGPENINIESPGDGNYTIGSHFYSGTTRTNVTVKVFIGGALRGEYFHQFSARNDFWQPVRIEWRNSIATLVDLDTFQTGFSCSFGP